MLLRINELFKVFDSVVPSLSFAIADVSIQAHASSYSSFAGETELTNKLAGNSSELKFKLLVPYWLIPWPMSQTSGGSSLNL